MNAYELAEQAEGLAYEIPADWSNGEPKNVATDIADMLRQQADRIETLQTMLAEYTALMMQQKHHIAELEKENYQQTHEGFSTIIDKTTPQIKELSDAEISEISHRYHYTYNPDYVGFARAILKKASEK